MGPLKCVRPSCNRVEILRDDVTQKTGLIHSLHSHLTVYLCACGLVQCECVFVKGSGVTRILERHTITGVRLFMSVGVCVCACQAQKRRKDFNRS